MQQLKIMQVDTESETYALLARNINAIRQAFHVSVIDLEFKAAKSRGADQYKGLTLDAGTVIWTVSPGR